MDLARLRNMGIVAHIDAGKTTLTERVLFYSGIEHRMGEVHEGTAVMDWMVEERKRGITITAAATTVPWAGHVLNIIDTPGHVDFTVEVERSMRVLDGAVLVLNAVAGVQAQSEAVWRQMRRHGVPYILFVNQYDRAGADFMRCVTDAQKRLEAPALPVQYPVGSERTFRGVVDLLTEEYLAFEESDLGKVPHAEPVPDSVREEVQVLRAELLDVLAEEDEAILQAVVDEQPPEVEALRAALRRRVIAGTTVPVLCGSALRNVGVQPLLDAVVAYLPSPLDRPAVAGRHPETKQRIERAPDPDGSPCALAFKLHMDPHEDLTFVRVYSGTISPGQKLWNPRARRMERVSRVLHMHADARRPAESAPAGDIVALGGLKLTATGDTLCDRADPIVLERLTFPESVITMVVEPLVTGDRDRLRTALDRLELEDPTFHVREDEETGQWLIAGMGELHLEVIQHRLEQDFHLQVKVGRPRVAYRESARTAGRGEARVDRVLGGKEVFGAVSLELLPSEGDKPAAIEWEPDCGVPEALREAVEDALAMGAQVGPRFGFPLVGARVRVLGGESQPGRDSEVGFRQAAALALRHAMQASQIDLLEPLMELEVQAPAEFMSGILADLNGRRADIHEVGVEGTQRKVRGSVPLANMFGYSTALRSLSQGRASFGMTPAGFVRVPDAELEERGLVWH